MENMDCVALLKGSEETEMDRVAERLATVTEMLERAVEKIAEREGLFAIEAEASMERIVATVEARHESELERRLMAAETELAELKAKAAGVSQAEMQRGRKTVPAAMVNLLAKQGVAVESIEAGALDAALVSLSLEQRIAVKAQLLRAGVIG